jgi:cysteine synthase
MRAARGGFVPLPVGNTPLVTIRLRLRRCNAILRLKLESFNPCGSIKDRTAVSLYESVANQLDPMAGLIESTSGNLGVALASLALANEMPFTAVVDPRAPAASLHEMRRLGARLVQVDEEDGHGGYLLSRLHLVADMLDELPGLCWTNQYGNLANPAAHELGTAPELAKQVPDDSVVLVAVSTGGTLAGLRRYAKMAAGWDVRGVDVYGSCAVGYAPGNRLLPGIGSSQQTRFTAAMDGQSERVDTEQSVAACLWLQEHCGIGVGASSGALVAAALRLIQRDGLDEVVCVCPDGARNYISTVYSSRWRQAHGIGSAIIPATCEEVQWEAP